MLRKLLIHLVLLLAPLTGVATHIVGGVLNYSYNGGNIYTVTLRLFRDCGSNTASFPGNITVIVKGNNGANFSPSRNLTIPLGAVTSVTAATDPCAVPPNPMPCVQQGVYTKTISLPPNVGGYHLYYQLEARNLSLTNINSSCNCIGETFYAYVPNYTVNVNGNSNAVFNSFPPLFLCVNQPFVIDHSATDADGDSLVYSLYAPYNGDNGNGPLDPTFSGNVAQFTPVNYLNGFTYLNPLGASPFSINPVTGVLTGTPGLTGQFVVGVRVREYRNGVYISESIRDFQFNVLNCPAPPPGLAVGNQTINNGCTKSVMASGLVANTITWNSIAPGLPGAYNNYLSCTSHCVKVDIAAVGTPPPFVDFVVCGKQANCKQQNVCDTFRVHFQPPLSVSIAPSNPALCNGQTSTTLIAIGSGGTPPYSYLWNNVNPSQMITVGAGTYNVRLSDVSGCPPVYASAVVTSYSVPVAITASPDRTRCVTSPLAGLGATVTGASGVVWSGGTGTFSPNNTSASNLFYTPTSTELAAGAVTLVVTTTGTGLCPPASDTVVITYLNFTGTVVATPTAVTCFGQSNGAASLSVNAGFSPHTYTWQVAPVVTGSVLSNKPAGTYFYSVTDNIGCSRQGSVSITQPPPLALSHTVTNATCFGSANGSASVTASGGTGPYTYSWMPVSQTGSVATALAAGSYSCRLTDSKGCTTTSVVIITQPASLTIATSQTNVACNSGTTGAITTTVTGGTAAYSYSWSPGGITTPGRTGISAGSHVLQVTDQHSCQATRTVVISQPPALNIVMSSTNESCNYLNNGAAMASVSGGTPGYTWSWSPGAATSSLATGLAAGVYSVTITDGNNCSANATTSISQPPVLSVVMANYSSVRCFGASDGSVTAVANGGVAPYSYSWTPSAVNTATLANRPAGSYTVAVTDANSCTTTAQQVITEPPALVQSAVISTVSCAGGNNASVTLSVTGGTGPYQYLWLPGAQNGATLSPVVAGTYTAVVTDANSCSVAATYSISEPQPISIALSPSLVACFGGSDGMVTSNVTGGHAPYTYSWSTGAGGQNLTGVSAGTYTLFVTDNLSCTASQTVEVTQPSQISVAATFTNESCDYLNDGAAMASGSGGTPPYTYTWQPGPVLTQSISALAAGVYSVTVSDSKGCNTFTQVTITEPAPLVPVLSSSAVSCFGGSDGMGMVQATGGTPNYQYTFSPSGSTVSPATNLSAGIHTVSVSDNNGCFAQATVQVTEPMPLSATENIKNVSCFNGSDGSISVVPAGGIGPYTFFWNPGGATSPTATGLSSGNYTVFIQDANNCTFSKPFVITQPSLLTINHTVTAVSCFAGPDGAVNASGSGGTSPYLYSWAHGPSTSSVNNLSAGVYSVTVTDSLLCTATATIQVTEPSLFVLATSFTNESCNYSNDGAASVIGSGGTGPYTYTWIPGSATTTLISGLAAGAYTVLASDANMCPAQAVVNVSEPAQLVISFSPVTPVSCTGGSDGGAQATVAGGTPNYTFAWSSGALTSALNTSLSAGVHTLTVTDQNGCTETATVLITEPLPLTITANTSEVKCPGGSDGEISLSINGGVPPYSGLIMPGNIPGSNFNNLTAGTYTIYSTDNNGCAASVTVTVDEALSLSTVASHTNPTCGSPNGAAGISITSGGVPPFTYSWNPTGATTPGITGLAAGSYTVMVTDSNGCVSTKVIDISNIGAPVLVVTSATNVSCFGAADAALTTSISGGTPPFIYLWSPVGGNGPNASNLPAGYYSVKVTDSLGCIGIVTSSFVSQPKPISIAITPSAVSCNGGSDGKASAQVAGGTPGYTYTWQSGVPAGGTVSGLGAGNYSLTVTDSKLCTQTTTFEVTEPTTLSLSVSASSVSCFGGADGIVSGTVAGGIAPYSYSWTPVNAGAQLVQNLTAGNYTLTARDNKGCTISDTISVLEPDPIALAFSVKDSDCSLANGEATVTATGGNGGYTYTWSPGSSTGSVVAALLAGTHTVSVKDINLCEASQTVTVNDNPAPVVAVSTVTQVSCFSGSDGAAQATVTGGSAPFSFTWSPSGGNSATASGLSAGQYTLLVVSANNCSVTAVSPVITEPAKVILNVSTNSVLCFGGNSGSASVTAFGGTGAYTYSWQAGVASGNSVSGLAQGVYTVEVRDANDCFGIASFTINQPQQQLSAAILSQSVFCNGGNNGSATVTASGGTAPYSFMWSPGQVSSGTIAGLTAGPYSVSVTDVNGCAFQSTVDIAEPTAISLSPGFVSSDCSAANGQASVTAAGGTPPYAYQWSPSGGTGSVAVSLFAGTYTVTVTDANNCVASSSTTVSDLPAPLVSVTGISSVSCFGGADGSATVTVSGGSGPFTYQWSAGTGSSNAVSGLPAGQHTVIVTSANACTVSAVTPVLTQPSALVISFNAAAVGCFGASNGSVTANVFGGTTPYSYTWSPSPGNTSTLQGLAAGNYTVNITDGNVCPATGTVEITQPAASLALSVNSSSVLCFGNASGSASVNVVGGTSPYFYNWSPAASTASAAGSLAAGVYSVSVTDSKGCGETATVAITEPVQALSVTVAVTDAACFGNATGSATANVSGGTPAYTYTWSAGSSTSSMITGLSANIYSVQIADQNLCAASASFAIGEPALLTATLLVTDPSCERSNGVISAQVSGGTAPFNYQWSAGTVNAPVITGLAAGSHTLQITDAQNCTAVLTASLTNIPGPTATIVSVQNVSCFGLADGGATLSVAGVSPPFVFQWVPSGGGTTTAQNLAAGVYTAIVSDSLGCATTATAEVTQPPVLKADIDSLLEVSCHNGADGMVLVSASGGTSPYTFSWAHGPTGQRIDSLSSGLYVVNIVDQNNCATSLNAVIAQPSELSVSASISRTILCFAGTGDASVAISGGTAPYAVNWSSIPSQNGNVLISVPAGSYVASITDNNGCVASDTVIFNQPSQISTIVSEPDTICAGTASLLTASAAGGVGNYTFNWAPVGAVNTGTLQITASNDISYTVVAFDQNGCGGTDAVSVVNVYNLVDSNLDLMGYSPICPGNASVLEAKVAGNTGPVTYTWSHNLPSGAGPHAVTPTVNTVYTVSASNECGSVVRKTTTVEIATPPQVIMSADSRSTCVPGSIQFRETGDAVNSADPVVAWSWNFGNGEISGEQEPQFYFSAPGTYSVSLTVTSDRGCVGTSTAPIVVQAFPQPVASFSLNKTVLQLPYDELQCTNHSVGATNYQWSFGDGTTSTLVNPKVRLQVVGESPVQLIAISGFGCTDTAIQYVRTSSQLVFPNAFTPNEEGSSGGAYDVTSLSNDVFFPYTSGVTDYSLQIFNRWGELIFESTDVKIGWDGYYKGVLSQQGVYVWKASAKLGDGSKFSQTGSLTLLRK